MKKIIVFFFSLFRLSIKLKIYLYDVKKNLNKTIKHFKIKSILDIGSNIGQFAENILESGFNGKIISFEPLSKEHQIIKKKMKILIIGLIRFTKNHLASRLLKMILKN